MAGQGSPLKMLFSHKIHFTSSPALFCPPCYILFSLFKMFLFPLVCDIWYQRAFVEMELSFISSTFAFFPPPDSEQGMAKPHFGDKALAGVFVTGASQMHNSSIWDPAYFSLCPETNLLTFSIYSKALMGSEWMKRKNLKYPMQCII